MQDVVRKCLQKTPKNRPSAKQLLEHKFFRQARDASYVKQHLLQGLPPLPERVAQIRAGKAATRARVSWA
jgi:serine/threonine-protein kinase OSR1/STK39